MLQPRIPGLQHFFHATDIIRTVLILRLDSVFRFQQKSIHAFIEGLPLPGGNEMIPLQGWPSLLPGMDLAISCVWLSRIISLVPAITRTGICKERSSSGSICGCVTINPQHFLIGHRLFRKQRNQGNHQIPHNNGKLNGIFHAFGKQIGSV